ncbi:hypothetical protein HZS_4256 [Henneguya salminicola]|nr:hypothetical protein HZS_4256 [Henneguya salminicola]
MDIFLFSNNRHNWCQSMLSFNTHSSTVLGLVVGGFIIAFTMSVGMGANDVANAFGTTYGAKLMNIFQIIIVASIFELAGALLIGTSVAETIRTGIIDSNHTSLLYKNSPNCITILSNSSTLISTTTKDTLYCPDMIKLIGSVSSLSGSSIWMIIANVFRLPVSTTHSIVGSTIGYGLVSLRGKGIFWRKLIEIVISWFLSPCTSGIISIGLWMLIYHAIIKKKNSFSLGLKSLPFFYFCTIFIILFSVLYKGSPLLHLDKIPLYGIFIICIGMGIIGALVAIIFQIPFLRHKYSSLSSAQGKLNHTLFGITNITTTTHQIDQSEENVMEAPEITEVQLEHDLSPVSAQTIIQELSTETPIIKSSIIAGDNLEIEKEPDIISPKYIDEDPRTAYIFRYMQIIIACYGSFAHGGNDVSNSIAPLMNIWLIFKNEGKEALSNKEIWLLVYGAVGMIIGLSLWGKRVLKTVGQDITKITPTMAYSIELGSVITVVVLTRLGLPVSTTHCKIGSVILLGLVRYERKSFNTKLIINILLSWLITVPVSGIKIYFIFRYS